MTGGTQIL